MAQEEIWFAAQTNPIELFPKFEEVSCGAGIEIPIEMKYEKQSKQILSNFSPKELICFKRVVELRSRPPVEVLPDIRLGSKADQNSLATRH